MTDDRLPTHEAYEAAVSRAEGAAGTPEREPIGGGSPVADGGFQIDMVTEALANERRRYVLYYLRDNESAELDELTEQVAVRETGTPPGELDEQTRRNVRIDLCHAQLPKLEDTGMIEYDRRHGSIRFRRPPDEVEYFLDYCATLELPDAYR